MDPDGKLLWPTAGMPTTEADTINADLLTFLKREEPSTKERPATRQPVPV